MGQHVLPYAADCISGKKKKPRLFPCGIKKQIISSSKVTWTIQSWLTWPQYEFPWELVKLLKLVKRFMQVFKLLINYIQRTFQAHPLNLTEQWMHTIERVFLGKKKKSVTCFSFFVVQPAALLRQFSQLSLCVSWRFSSVTPKLHTALFTAHWEQKLLINLFIFHFYVSISVILLLQILQHLL